MTTVTAGTTPGKKRFLTALPKAGAVLELPSVF